MVSALSPLEAKLGELYKSVPNLPENWRKSLSDFMPWLALIVGVLSLLAAWGVWGAGMIVNSAVSYTNALNSYYRPPTVATAGWTLWLWLALITILAEGVLYLLAFPALRAHKKMGWDLLFYGALVNLAYAIVVIFAFPVDGVGRLIGSLIGSAIGFYFLYQIRSYYAHKA